MQRPKSEIPPGLTLISGSSVFIVHPPPRHRGATLYLYPRPRAPAFSLQPRPRHNRSPRSVAR
eukprot:scaffold1237_cov29-Tisochrysis_lutea.AAC.4